MCGINLTIGRNKTELMNAALGHRGVRSNVVEFGEGIYLGHVRLPIQGLDKEHDHPKTVGDLTGAFVGEIFNYKEILPSAKTDLPVLLSLIQQYGVKGGLRKCDGFWSIIFRDRQTGNIHIITDFLAKKPLYYRTDTVGFSSEISPLLHLGPVTPDESYFSAVMKWGYLPRDETPFREVKKVPPNTHIVLNRYGVKIYSDRYDELTKNSSPDIISLRRELDSSVKNRLVSDVPVSILMSGGLDSTVIYYIARRYTDHLNIFHVENDEAEYLKYIDFRPGDSVTPISINESDYDLDQILLRNDGPVDLGSVVPQFLLSKEINKKGFKVCLSGDGADELFGGYKRAAEYDSQYSDVFHELVYYHLPRLDKMMMANLVELRSPFLSRGVIEQALGFEYDGLRTSKQILKKISIEVPAEIINRRKKPLRYKTGPDWRRELINRYRKLIWR